MFRINGVAVGVFAAGLAVVPIDQANAQSRSLFFDIDAAAGYSKNPYLSLDDDGDSAFGRISATAAGLWEGARSETRVSGYGEKSFASGNAGSQELLALTVRTEFRPNERWSLFGSAEMAADFGGSLASRPEPLPISGDPVAPPILPPTMQDPDLLGLTGRQYRWSAQAGASSQISERSTVSMSAGFRRVAYSGTVLADADYSAWSGSGAFERQLNERWMGGVRLAVQRSNGSGGSTLTANPQLTARSRLSEAWDAQAAAGVLLVQENSDVGDDFAATLSLDGSLCRNGPINRICARVSRYGQVAAAGTVRATTSAAVDYYRQLDRAQTLRLSASVIHYSGGVASAAGSSEYYSGQANYSRDLSDRFAAGADVIVRKLRSGEAADPDAGISLLLFLRYRMGDRS